MTPRAANGLPKRFHGVILARLINVGREVGALMVAIKEFSHGSRDLRNYVHRNQELRLGFTPDEHIAKTCFQVLKATLADLAWDR